MTNVIIVTLGALLFAYAYMSGLKKTYYALKYMLFKPIEWLMRTVIALFGINVFVWTGFFVLLCLFDLCRPEREIGTVWMFGMLVYAWVIVLLIYRNLKDEDDRDLVRMLLAQVEHRLCFNNRKLSMYPDDWHWYD